MNQSDSSSGRRPYTIGAILLAALTLMMVANERALVRATEDDQYCGKDGDTCFVKPNKDCSGDWECLMSKDSGCFCVNNPKEE